MKIKITSDSTCDLPKQLLEQYDITTIALTVVKDGMEYRDGVDIAPADIFSHVEAGGALCSTSAVNIGEYQAFFSRYASKYDAVIHINLGSGFSTCYQSASLAAQEFDNVRVIDSMSLSTGQGYVTLAAWKYAQESDDLDEICAKVENLRGRVEASFLLNRLDYMVKGGRCSSAVALGANLLNLKPCIEVKDNKMVVTRKYRGNYPKCLGNYVKDRLEGRSDVDDSHIFITYTTIDEPCYHAVTSAIEAYGNFRQVQDSVAGCTVSCHCGPDTLGIICVRK